MKHLQRTALQGKTQKKYHLSKAILFMVMLSVVQLSAQDIILMKDGSEVQAKIIEINDLDVKYKKSSNPEGPTYSARKNTIFYVKYEDGAKEVFNEQPDIMKSTYVDPLPQAPNTRSKYDPDTSDFAKKKRKCFSGPRVGLAFVGPGTTSDYLVNDKGGNPFLTQFGWQFEGRLFTTQDGTSGLLEFVPMIGGIEQGLFLPSANFLLGLRSGKKASWEFAMGPHFGFKANHEGNVEPAMGLVVAFGTSFKKDNVWFPVTLAFIPSVGSKESVEDPISKKSTEQNFETGFRMSLIVGFNYRRK